MNILTLSNVQNFVNAINTLRLDHTVDRKLDGKVLSVTVNHVSRGDIIASPLAVYGIGTEAKPYESIFLYADKSPELHNVVKVTHEFYLEDNWELHYELDNLFPELDCGKSKAVANIVKNAISKAKFHTQEEWDKIEYDRDMIGYY